MTTRVVQLAREDDFDGWRIAARSLASLKVPADRIVWQIGDRPGDLFAGEPTLLPRPAELRVPKDFVELAGHVVLHSDPQRFSLLYALLLRVLDRPQLMKDPADRDLRRVQAFFDTIRRDMHKMRAYVRFREVVDGGRRRSIAWFEPDHHIVRANAGFFVDRFTNLQWSILTPKGSIHWDGAILSEGPPAQRGDAPSDDPVEAVWKAYYAAIFNPARLMKNAMLREMPRKYWKNMPETALVPELIANARKRELGMIEQAQVFPVRSRGPSALTLLGDEAEHCRRCPLWQPATQMVFGEGPHDAEIMIVGEQPGDKEDILGRPFVGPAGELFDRALLMAGIDRLSLYVTNAVKHFKFERRGKRRIHSKPNVSEIEACRWWVDQERAIIQPKLIIAMGATAARSLVGRSVSVGRERSRPIALGGGVTGWITVHPSYLLRLPVEVDAKAEFDRYVADLRQAVAFLHARR